MNSNKSQQQKTLEQYTKSCIKNNPYSLSMLKSPLEVVNKVYSLYNCVCLIYWPLCERQIFCDYFIIKDWIQTDLNMKVISFQTREQIVLYLNQIQPSISVFIIYHSKEQYGLYSLLTEVMGRKQVKLTIVYCLDSYKDIIKYHPSKKKEIADSITQVMTLLEEEKKKCFDRRQAPNSLFSLKNKTEEQKIYVEVIFSMLNQQIDRVQAAKSFQLLFKEMLFDEREGLQEISEFVKLVQRKLPLQDVFTWYTKQTFVFSLLGKVMRYCHDPRQVYYIQPFFQDLYKSIQTLYQFQVQNKEQKILQCFRGGKIEQKQLKYLKQNVGHIIQNRLFLSTTTQQSITLHYIQNIKYKITISHDSVISHEQRNKGYINPGYAQIKQYSFYSSEQEVLFNPLNYFLIKSLNQEMINDIQYYELCMEFIDMARILSMQDNIMSEQQKQIKDEGLKQLQLRKKIKCQGDVLSNNTNVYPQGNYQYWKQFLANSNNQEQICIGLDHLCRYHKEIQNLQEEKDQFSAYF